MNMKIVYQYIKIVSQMVAKTLFVKVFDKIQDYVRTKINVYLSYDFKIVYIVKFLLWD